MSNQPTFIDLFAGAGLFSYGMTLEGFSPVLAIELSKDAAASYSRNVSGCVVQGSVERFDSAPRADVLIAGPPCQGFSTLGRRDPSDVRNELSLSVLAWADMAEPRIVVVENVPQFLRSPQWQALRSGLTARGYEVAAWELDALDFGTPQRRRRAFTVGSRVGPVAPPEATSGRPTVGETILSCHHPMVSSDPMHVWPTPVGIAAQRIALVPPNGDKRDLLSSWPELCPGSWAKVGCHATDVWGRMDPTKPANTIRCAFQNPSKGRYIHPTEHRVLSLREAARLQGVPDEWMFVGRRYPIARQIGNGVPIQLGRAVSRSLAAALG